MGGSAVPVFRNFPGALEKQESPSPPPISCLRAPEPISALAFTDAVSFNPRLFPWRAGVPGSPILQARKLRLTLVVSNSPGTQIQVLGLVPGSLYPVSGSVNPLILSPDVTKRPARLGPGASSEPGGW